jgi:hypothetical protein
MKQSANRLALCASLFLISFSISATSWANNGASVSDAPKAPSPAPSPAASKPAAIPGVPLPAPSAQANGDPREGGSAEDLLNSKNALGRTCRDANGDKVYPSDPDYNTKCAPRTRGARRPKVSIPIPGDD